MSAINVVWFKRDLRLDDHAPLQQALATGRPILLLYIAEPALLGNPHYDVRHWRFARQSLRDMNRRLKPLGIQVEKCRADVIALLDFLHSHVGIAGLYSHEETGLEVTYSRDRAVQTWCHVNHIPWYQSPTGAVIRGLRHRHGWDDHWTESMRADQAQPDWSDLKPVSIDLSRWQWEWPVDWPQRDDRMQYGGESSGWHTLNSFFVDRGQSYAYRLSSPSTSREHCSRLSPYLAWGNLSMRQVYQTLLAHWHKPGWRKSLSAFASRLHWQGHFIQKFESEARMEFEAVNRGFMDLNYRDDAQAERDLDAWKNGQTGYPLVDACMRAVTQTGYLNFRMRAMLVSFLTHHLWIDWRLGVEHLAQQFLDFEPGIHYAQFQMQAGHTGLNTVRIYNPVKQAQDNDPNAEFIRSWVPELQTVPIEFCHAPWELPPLDALLIDFELGRDYPERIVDIQQAGAQARARLWQHRNAPQVVEERARLLARHVRPES